MGGGKSLNNQSSQAAMRLVPHARTLRKARIQVQLMVTDGDSHQHIKRYLNHFFRWWTKTVDNWKVEELMIQFLRVCWDARVAAYVASLLYKQFTQCGSDETTDLDFHFLARLGVQVAA